MKTKVLKLSGALAIIALFASSFAAKAKSQTVSIDDVHVTEAANLEDVLGGKGEWTFVSSDYVYTGTK
jgi:hypothetical protein